MTGDGCCCGGSGAFIGERFGSPATAAVALAAAAISSVLEEPIDTCGEGEVPRADMGCIGCAAKGSDGNSGVPRTPGGSASSLGTRVCAEDDAGATMGPSGDSGGDEGVWLCVGALIAAAEPTKP